jgi:hypothetical protein
MINLKKRSTAQLILHSMNQNKLSSEQFRNTKLYL